MVMWVRYGQSVVQTCDSVYWIMWKLHFSGREFTEAHRDPEVYQRTVVYFLEVWLSSWQGSFPECVEQHSQTFFILIYKPLWRVRETRSSFSSGLKQPFWQVWFMAFLSDIGCHIWQTLQCCSCYLQHLWVSHCDMTACLLRVFQIQQQLPVWLLGWTASLWLSPTCCNCNCDAGVSVCVCVFLFL